jgi:integrase
MTSIRLKYVQAFVDRKTGAVFRYFRRPGYPRIRLPGLPGSAEFNRAYEGAIHGPVLVVGAKRTKPGTLHAAVAGYFTSLEFRTLKPGTQHQRRAILLRFDAAHGDKPIALLPPEFLHHMLKSMKPFQARNWLKAIRGLMAFCVAEKFIAADPTRDIKLAKAKSAGFHTWTEDDIAAFESHHPIGGKARLALALLLYTAQRRGDVIRMGRQHIRDGVLHVKQEKTGVELDIPVHSDLKAIIDATPSEHLTFIVGERGRPMTPTFFSRWFRAQCDDASLPKCCKAHGLRKAACRRLAEAGCTVHEIKAISGHKSLREVERYTEAAEQAKLARNAMARTKPETLTVKIADV